MHLHIFTKKSTSRTLVFHNNNSNYDLTFLEINMDKKKLLQKTFHPIVPLVLNELVSRLMQKSAPQNMTTINECVAWLISED